MSNTTPDERQILAMLEEVRKMTPLQVTAMFQGVIPPNTAPTAYLQTLDDGERITALRAILLCWIITYGRQIPREIQLRSCLAIHNKRDCYVHSGTGTGKTLPIVLNILLHPPDHPAVFITISPLKRLQKSQTHDFGDKYGIPTVAINDETPHDEDWWRTWIYDPKTQSLGKARHIITTVEQLFKSPQGHIPPLGRYIMTFPAFRKCITHINVDEGHFIVMAGQSRYGKSAFRPAWFKLPELRACISREIPWRLMSATLPPHILATVTARTLRPDHDRIVGPLNRPNITYARYQVPTCIDDVSNYSCFVKRMDPFTIKSQPRVLIFADDRKLVCAISRYLDGLLPQSLQKSGIVKHYHSLMSLEYQSLTHTSFTEENGTCRILCSTSGQSNGVDFSDVKYVCNAGLPNDLVDTLQRAGRLGRRPGEEGLFIVFYETWAHTISLSEYTYGDPADPDRPRFKLPEKQSTRPVDRASYASIQFVQTGECLRRCFAQYLGDQSPEALHATASTGCCQNHANQEFDLNKLLPSPLNATYPTGATKRRHARLRTPQQRILLERRLVDWTLNAHENDPLKLSREYYDILADMERQKLVRLPAFQVREGRHVTEALNEDEDWGKEWAESIAEVIRRFDDYGTFDEENIAGPAKKSKK